jgi:outer membrane biosynthesis protein TonB
MAAGHAQTDVLSRVRREQRMHRKPSRFSGLRIVLAAAGITLAILLFAFGAIGMLMMARNPQEPLASKLDPAPPFVQQVETPVPEPEPAATSTHEKTPEPEITESGKKPVKTLRVVTPPAVEKNETVVEQQAPQADPETTATVPPAQVQELREEPRPVVKQRPRVQQRRVYRPARKQERQPDNPLYQLFGIKQYR